MRLGAGRLVPVDKFDSMVIQGDYREGRVKTVCARNIALCKTFENFPNLRYAERAPEKLRFIVSNPKHCRSYGQIDLFGVYELRMTKIALGEFNDLSPDCGLGSAGRQEHEIEPRSARNYARVCLNIPNNDASSSQHQMLSGLLVPKGRPKVRFDIKDHLVRYAIRSKYFISRH